MSTSACSALDLNPRTASFSLSPQAMVPGRPVNRSQYPAVISLRLQPEPVPSPPQTERVHSRCERANAPLPASPKIRSQLFSDISPLFPVISVLIPLLKRKRVYPKNGTISDWPVELQRSRCFASIEVKARWVRTSIDVWKMSLEDRSLANCRRSSSHQPPCPAGRVPQGLAPEFMRRQRR